MSDLPIENPSDEVLTLTFVKQCIAGFDALDAEDPATFDEMRALVAVAVNALFPGALERLSRGL